MAAASSEPITRAFPVTSAPIAKLAMARVAEIGAELDSSFGKVKCVGPGQSVPKINPGPNHGPVMTAESETAQPNGANVRTQRRVLDSVGGPCKPVVEVI